MLGEVPSGFSLCNHRFRVDDIILGLFVGLRSWIVNILRLEEGAKVTRMDHLVEPTP